MKEIEDYRNEVFEEMSNNGTLSNSGGDYYPSDDSSDAEIIKALISRFSEKINDALYQPYGNAVINGTPVDPILDKYVTLFANEIISICDKWSIPHFSHNAFETCLRSSLSDRYKTDTQ